MMICCQLAEKHILADQVQLKHYFQSIYKSVEDSAALTKQLLTFARKQILDLRILSLNDLLRSKEETLKRLFDGLIELKLELAPELDNVKVDSSQMDQLILNLCINARDAMPNGGRITLRTSNELLNEKDCAYHPDVLAGNYVMLSVSDTGIGMTNEVKARIFDPFFTTKQLGKGTGLGLASVHGIVGQSRGHILVESQVNVGTTFKIYFPKTQETVPELKKAASQKPHVGGNEMILLLEDEDLLRESLALTLEGAGYKVLQAGDIDEARLLFNKHKEEISLLVTDVILPKMKGTDVAELFKKESTDLKVIFISGFAESGLIIHGGTLNRGLLLLQKPFTMQHFLATVRKSLNEKDLSGVY